jgi:hypothetical protein
LPAWVFGGRALPDPAVHLAVNRPESLRIAMAMFFSMHILYHTPTGDAMAKLNTCVFPQVKDYWNQLLRQSSTTRLNNGSRNATVSARLCSNFTRLAHFWLKII